MSVYHKQKILSINFLTVGALWVIMGLNKRRCDITEIEVKRYKIPIPPVVLKKYLRINKLTGQSIASQAVADILKANGMLDNQTENVSADTKEK